MGGYKFSQINNETGWELTPQQAKAQMQQPFPTLSVGRGKMEGV